MKKNQTILPTLIVGIVSVLTSGVAFADDVFVSNNGDGSIEEIVGDVTSTFISPTPNLVGPTGVAVHDGVLYVANNSSPGVGFVAEYSATIPNDFLGDYAVGLYNPRGIVFDSAGNLYIANQSSGKIVEITAGSPLGSAGTVIASGLSFPNGLTITDGNLYVGNGGTSTIDEISLSTHMMTAPFVSGLSNPNGLATEGGFVYEMDTGTSSINKVDSTGTVVESFPEPTVDNGKGLAIDSDGDFYVTDEGNSTVTEYNPDGSLKETYSTGFSGPNYVTVSPLTVPEPSTYALLTAGLGMLFVMFRRKKASL